MSNVSKASSPGKIILFGEHSVVYPPNRAILTTIDLHMVSESKEIGKGGDVFFIEPGSSPEWFGNGVEFGIEDLLIHYEKACELHAEEKYDDLQKFMKEEKGFIKVFFGLVQKNLNNKLGYFPSLEVTRNVGFPFASGFGSSSSYSSSIIASTFDACGIPLSEEGIFNLTYRFEEFQNGTPSGADPAVIINGGLVEFNKNKDKKVYVKKLEIENEELKEILNKCWIIYSGSAKESTAEMVGYVRDRYKEDEKKIKGIFAGIEDCIDGFLGLATTGLLTTPNPSYHRRGTVVVEFKKMINRNGELLEELGVVSELGESICQEIRDANGAAKVVGAGGQKDASGAILVYHEDRKFIKKLVSKYNVKLYEAGFGVEGTKVISN